MQQNIMENFSELATVLDGKLLRIEEIPFKSTMIELLLSKKLLDTKPAITKTLLTTTCKRCGNKDNRYFAEIPCKKCSRTHLYCRKCIEMGRVMECESLYYWIGPPAIWPTHQNPSSWEGTLTTAQEKAANRIKTAIINQEKEILVWAVCGAGKTEMLFPGISKALERGMRVCLATPRADVVKELKPRLLQAFEGVSIQALYGGNEDKGKDAQFVIATTHQLLRYQSAFDVMIVDEVDAFPFHADPSLPFAQKRAAKQNGTTIYLTATPRQNLKKAINRKKLPHVFVPVRYHGHPLPIPTLKMCYSLQKDLAASRAPSRFLPWLLKRTNPERQLLIFVPTIDLVNRLKTPLLDLFIAHRLIKNETELVAVDASDEKREEKVMAFRQKKLKVILTTTILERGVTFPSVDVAIFHAGHDVFDEAALVQIAGRAGRNANDPNGEVVFFHDGKTEAMLEAIYQIKQMNKRGGF